MSNGLIIEPAPVPPSIAGIPQPVFESGSATEPATPIDITGSPIIPPPTIGDPVGFPVFPPEPPDTAPVPVPVGPLVGPAIGVSPDSLPGVPQPQFVTGSVAVPPTMFPGWTLTHPPSPPIVFANIFNLGNVAPPSTTTTPTIPWSGALTPSPTPLAPVNVETPILSGTPEVGDVLTTTYGAWDNEPDSFTIAWYRGATVIAGATGDTYTLVAADLGTLTTSHVTAINSAGSTTAISNAIGPIVAAPPAEDPETADAPDDDPPARTRTVSRARRKRV